MSIFNKKYTKYKKLFISKFSKHINKYIVKKNI